MAVYEQRWGAAVGPLCVYLHRVGDPGNVGTVLRSAQAFGASCVALGPGCADPHGPKAVRASMGAIFTVALAHVSDVDRAARRAGRAGRRRASEPPARAAQRPGCLTRRSRCSSAPSATACPRGHRRVRARRAHPDRLGLAERGHGRDGGAVRDDPPTASLSRPPQRYGPGVMIDRIQAAAGRGRERDRGRRLKRASSRSCACATSGARPSCRRCCAASPRSSPPSAAPSARPPTRRARHSRR